MQSSGKSINFCYIFEFNTIIHFEKIKVVSTKYWYKIDE